MDAWMQSHTYINGHYTHLINYLYTNPPTIHTYVRTGRQRYHVHIVCTYAELYITHQLCIHTEVQNYMHNIRTYVLLYVH